MTAVVSVITPSYNSAGFIDKTVSSVINQSFKNWEMIIVDDCSTDNSLDVIHALANQDSRIKLISLTRNSGAAVARNVAIESAKGRYIAFLDSDDVWLPDKLEIQLKFMQDNSYPFTYTAYYKVNQQGKLLGHVGVTNKVTYFDLLKTNSIGSLTAVYDTECFGKVLMPLIRKRQDLGLWLTLLKKTDYAYGLNKTLAQYCIRTDSISANKANAAKFTWRLYRDIEGLNLIKASYYFSHYAIRGLLRTKAPGLARLLGVLK